MLCNKTRQFTGLLLICIVKTETLSDDDVSKAVLLTFVCHSSKKKLCAIYGKWTQCLYTVDATTFDAHKKTDKKNSDEKKSNKQVFYFTDAKGPYVPSPSGSSYVCVSLCGPRAVWMRSQKRCLHPMLRQSRSSQAVSSSGR